MHTLRRRTDKLGWLVGYYEPYNHTNPGDIMVTLYSWVSLFEFEESEREYALKTVSFLNGGPDTR